MTTLISFLGRGQNNRGYNTTHYQFEDGFLCENQKYAGLALLQKIKPSKLILLGTSSSMWDVFFERGFDNLGNQWVHLSDAVRDNIVSAEMLEPFERYLTEKLNTEVQCILIPFAKELEEQIEILTTLSDKLSKNEEVVVDVSNGFRHLSMLALVACRFLKRTKNIHIKNIYYGAWEMKEGDKTPFVKLDGMLAMLDWIDALTIFDKDGDYEQFADLLVKENFDKNTADLLRQASFFERTSNSPQAYNKLKYIFKDLKSFSSPIFDLFKPQLVKRLTWFERSDRGLREQKLAYEYLNRKDYVRAVIYAQEGKISRELSKDKVDLDNHDLRKKKLKQLPALQQFKELRNKLAHGNNSDNEEINSLTQDESKLVEYLKQKFKEFTSNE